MTKEARIQKMAKEMVKFSCSGFKVSKTERADLMKQALINATELVEKMGDY